MDIKESKHLEISQGNIRLTYQSDEEEVYVWIAEDQVDSGEIEGSYAIADLPDLIESLQALQAKLEEK